MAGPRGKQEVVVQDVGGQVPAVFTHQDMAKGFAVAKLAGQLEAAHFYETVSQKVMIESYMKIKESKEYMGLPYKDTNGELKHVSDLEEFCRVFLGKTYGRMQQLERTYHMLGADLYEKAKAVGMTSRDFAAIKALPENDRQIIKDAMEDGDKDRILATMEDLILKHNREKEAAAERIRVLEAKTKAGEAMLKEKDDKLRETFLELQTMKNYTPSEQADLTDLQYVRALQGRGNGVDLALAQLSVVIGDYLQDGVTEAKETNILGLMAFLGERFNEVLRTHQIRLNFQDIVNPPYDIDLFGESLVVGRRTNGE